MTINEMFRAIFNRDLRQSHIVNGVDQYRTMTRESVCGEACANVITSADSFVRACADADPAIAESIAAIVERTCEIYYFG